MASNDIPPQCRGTIRFGKNPQPWHYQRSDKTGQLFIIPGEDLRDWDKIASGALDYQHIAFQEHQATPHGQKFAGHDGQKAHDACPVCAADEKRPPVLAYAVPDEVPPDVQAVNDQHAAQLAAEAAQAAADNLLKQTLPPAPTTLADQAAQARIGELEAALAAATAEQPPTAQAATAGVTPLPVDTASTVFLPSAVQRAVDNGALTHDIPSYDEPDAAGPRIAPDLEIRPTHGTDPWTGETVPIWWKIDGASPTHPYGAKKNGEPRRPVGRKENTTKEAGA